MAAVVCWMDDMPTFWIGESLEACIADYVELHGGDQPEDAYVLSEDELDSNRIAVEDENEQPTGEVLTFREYIAREYPDGIKGAEFFACQE